MLEEVGNIGYQVGALGIAVFTVAFLVIVRWWSDSLGRVIALVFSATSAVLVMAILRMLGHDQSQMFYFWRMIVFWLFGVGVWWGLLLFLWAQFGASRSKHRDKLTTPITRRQANEEGTVASSRTDRHDHPDDSSAGHG